MSMKPMEPLVDLLKTLAHPARLRILALLRDGELCVCQISAVLGLASSTVSEHLTALRRSGLLSERKEGRWVYYDLKPKGDLHDLVEVLWVHMDQVQPVRDDKKRARAVRCAPASAMCPQDRAGRVAAGRRQSSRAGTGVPHPS